MIFFSRRKVYIKAIRPQPHKERKLYPFFLQCFDDLLPFIVFHFWIHYTMLAKERIITLIMSII